MTNFTQDKWQLDEDSGLVYTDDGTIAQVAHTGTGKYATDEGNANARLIQAAPELFRLLRIFANRQ